MAKFKTDKEFKELSFKKFPQINILSEYVDMKHIMNFECTKHNFLFQKTAYNFINSAHGCNLCAKESSKSSLLKSHEWFVNELDNTLPDIEVLSTYAGMQKCIKVRCKICGNIWSPKAGDLHNGHGCKKCSILKLSKQRTKSYEEFCDLIKKYNPSYLDFDIISKYQNLTSKIRCRCHTCKNEWETTASNLVDKRGGSGCPYCAQSKGEAIAAQFLTRSGIEFERQKQYDGLLGVNGNFLSYDFYIPSTNTLIEIQGLHHFEKVNYFGGQEKFIRQQEHDKRKRNYAEENGIKLLEIEYLSANDLEKIVNILSDHIAKVPNYLK